MIIKNWDKLPQKNEIVYEHSLYRNTAQEEELRASTDPKHGHLNEDLHVEISTFASPAEAHARVALALSEVRAYLIPDSNDQIRLQQMRDIKIIKMAGAPLQITNEVWVPILLLKRIIELCRGTVNDVLKLNAV